MYQYTPGASASSSCGPQYSTQDPGPGQHTAPEHGIIDDPLDMRRVVLDVTLMKDYIQEERSHYFAAE